MERRDVRYGTAQSLVAALLRYAADRDTHGKHERARAAREAAHELSADGGAVEVEGVLYVVSDTSDHYSEFTGTRAEVLAELDDFGEACVHDGKIELAKQIAAAHAEIESGDDSARVGFLAYAVSD